MKDFCGEDVALVTAALNGDLHAVRRLLTQGAEVDAKFDGNGLSALISAAKHGHEEVVRLLLDVGADINTQLSDGRTALSYRDNLQEDCEQNDPAGWHYLIANVIQAPALSQDDLPEGPNQSLGL